MNDIVQRAIAGARLEPWERALLKALWGVILAGLVAAVGYVAASAAHDPSLANVSWIAVVGVGIKTAVDVAGKLMAKSTDPVILEAAPVVEAAGVEIAAAIGKPAPKQPS